MKQLKIIVSQSNNVYVNLALEEYLVLHSAEDILLFYINTDAVVIGKHQNPWKEVDLAPINSTKNLYTVARRLSGGGTVFHDSGNINFAFIRNKNQDFVNFREHIKPISDALISMGIPNEISPRNDIFVKNHKVSGNAEHVNSTVKRILHHGTLLYDSNIVKLNGSIKPKERLNIKTHAVESVRSSVMNIREVANLGTTTDFLNSLIDHLPEYLTIRAREKLLPEEITEVSFLVTSKYATWEWNFGHTPQFSYVAADGTDMKIRKSYVVECAETKWIGKRFDKVLYDEKRKSRTNS